MGGGTLSDDTLVEIVTRLPLESFSRSKCVSKSWQSLLSNEYVRSKLPLIVSAVFQNSNSSLKNGPDYFLASDDDFNPTHFDFFPFYAYSTLIDSANGLLLFFSSITKDFYVCNPTTKRFVSLPKPSKETKLSILAFDPYYSRRYKVVSFADWHEDSADIELFDSETNAWDFHEVRWGIDTNSLSATMKYIEGVLYILAQPKQVVAIDLENMEANCRIIELPEAMKRECCIGKMGRMVHYSTNDGNQMRMWMLRDDDGGWVLKHYVSCSKIGRFRLLGLHPEKDVVYLCVNDKLVAYDVCQKRAEEEWDVGEDDKGYLVQVCVFPFSKYLENSLCH